MTTSESAVFPDSENQVLDAWATQLAATVQRLTGVRPSIQAAGRADQADARAFLWWELATGSTRAKIHVGAVESSWRSLAARVLSASPSIEAYVDPKQVYVNLLEQSSEQKGVVSTQFPPCNQFELVDLRFPDQAPIRLLLGIEEKGSPKIDSSLGMLSGVELPIIVRFGSTQMFLQDLACLDVGSFIEFDRRVDEPVDILINGQVVARGEAVVVRGNYGVNITEVTSRQERLTSSSYKVVREVSTENKQRRTKCI